MICSKCKATVPDGSVYCSHCGKKLNVQKRKSVKTRGNGQGTAYQRPGERTWTVEVVVGWKFPSDPSKPKRPVRKKRGGFSTKKEALAYASELQLNGNKRVRMTMEQVYLSWKASYEQRIDASTMGCYISAYKHYSSLHGSYMENISSEDLQSCMDACKAGKRTHQNMRTIAGLLWHYAIDKNIIDRDVTKNLYTGKGRSVPHEPLTPEEEKTIRNAIGKERYAEYVICLLNLGFRPGEFLELKKSQLFFANLAEKPEDDPVPVWYFVNGKKTEAGRDRYVVIPDTILSYILERTYIPGTDLMFPMYLFDRKKEKLVRFKQMTDSYFREHVFKPMMFRLHIAEGKVPYGARHSYANKLKYASGSDKDKSELIGHASYDFTKSAYQTSDLADLKAVVESFK